jgi:hypothetical protein
LVRSSLESHRFGSSGLILTSEEILLGAILRITTEGTRSNARQWRFQILNVLHHAGEELIVGFCRKPKVPRASTRRLWWIDGAEVGVVMWAEAKN